MGKRPFCEQLAPAQLQFGSFDCGYPGNFGNLVYSLDMSEEAGTSESSSTSVPNQLAILVPSFDPSKDDLQVYAQKVVVTASMAR